MKQENIRLDPANRADNPEQDDFRDDGTHEVLPDLAYKRIAIVNVVFHGPAHQPDLPWVLIDAGVNGGTGMIRRAAQERFSRPPAAIILTHAHFDHVGCLEQLASEWNVPIYAHALEYPYLDGSASYPAPDPGAGGGLMARLSGLYPRGPVDVREWLRTLPQDGEVPYMEMWQWIHLPGHTPGQVGLWREADRTLIAGDAVVTTRQESAYSAIAQSEELNGPPAYYTQNWEQARESVQRVAALEPEILLTGHGRAMRGAQVREGLHRLAADFDELARPAHGKYVEEPVQAQDGTAYDQAK
ncbi:MAG: MBL fold metallo-hydrolase [Verrucomicrobiota bacterium]|nr:MBL fold metallo-hydrolase [Verrucomicrobiota bacterium]